MMVTRASKRELHRELHDPRIESGRDRPEVRGAKQCCRGAVIHRVQQIEHFGPQLDRPIAPDLDETHHREIAGAIRDFLARQLTTKAATA